MNELHVFDSASYLAVILQALDPDILRETELPQWYEAATGIIAIPAALIGLPYAYLLIGKTRLESQKIKLDNQKTKLEILEKQHQLDQLDEPTLEQANAIELIDRTHETRLALLLVVRFIVLFLLISAFGVIDDSFSLFFTSVMFGAIQIMPDSFSGWPLVLVFFVQKIPNILYWILFFSLSWPLFKDANAFLGIDVKSFLKIPSLRGLQNRSL